MRALENPHHYTFLQHITRPYRGSARPSKDPLATDWGKGGVLGPSKVARSGLQLLCTSSEVSDSPVRLFWVSSFNELI